MGKPNVVDAYNGILFGHKNEVLTHTITWMDLENIGLELTEARHRRPHKVPLI